MSLDEQTKSIISEEIDSKFLKKEVKIFNILSIRKFWTKIIGAIGILTFAFSGLFWLCVNVIDTSNLSRYQAAVLMIITLSCSGITALALVMLARSGKDDY